MNRTKSLVLALAVMATALPLATIVEASAQVPESPVAAVRETEPVVLTGANFPTWAVPADITAKAPSIEGKQCIGAEEAPEEFPPILWGDEHCTHNEYEDPEVSTGEHSPLEGKPVGRLLGYRWDGERFVQIPFQVDEMTQRYLSNNKSGFAFYSETDPHHTYIFNREGFRWTGQTEDPCEAAPVSDVAPDPVQGLDTDDELVFMARDVGGMAPTDAPLPVGVEDSYQVVVTDPISGAQKFAYVMLAGEDGPKPAFDENNGYVKYERDLEANRYLFSESSYDSYGAAPEGAYWDPATETCVTDKPKQRRPGDQATVSTPRYRFRYEGRWLMTEVRVAPKTAPADCLHKGTCAYGHDLVDQWKARAFQQRPSGETPCCGFEEEVNNWGGSSILMGERWGPVRVIRETWGADSGTNVVRREIFYRDEIRFGTFLRVHVIPPLDGIYAQWDYNALRVETYYNQFKPDGVRIDGKNDENFGNSRLHVSSNGAYYCGQDNLSEAVGMDDCENTPATVGEPKEPCPANEEAEQIEAWWDEYIVDNDPVGQIPDDPTGLCIFNDIDSPDPTFSGVNAGLNWEEVAGPNGSLVMRTGIKQFTPGGTAQSLLAVPYYRDDSCFDDGTGSNPGPHLHGRGVDGDQPADSTWTDENGVVRNRECWDYDNPDHVAALKAAYEQGLDGHPRFYQGSVGTHGVHILLIGDSDNAGTTLPLTEIDSEQRMVVLPGEQENVGEAYGRHTEKPLVAVAHPEKREQGSPEPEPTETPSPTPSETASPTPTPTESTTPDPEPTESTTPDPEPTESTTPDPGPSNTNGPPEENPGEGGGQPPSNEPTQTPDEQVTEDDGPGSATTSLAADRGLVRFNAPVTLQGRVESTGCDSSPTTVSVQRRDHGTDSFTIVDDDIEVSRDGSWSTTVRHKVNAAYVATPASSADCIATSSAPVDVLVRAKIALRTVDGDCGRGRFVGEVLPNHSGGRVVLQQKNRGRFKFIGADRLNRKSVFTLRPEGCRKTYRVVFKKHDVRNERAAKRFRF